MSPFASGGNAQEQKFKHRAGLVSPTKRASAVLEIRKFSFSGSCWSIPFASWGPRPEIWKKECSNKNVSSCVWDPFTGEMEQRIQRTFRHDSKDKKCGFTLLSLKRNVPSWIRVISCSWTIDRWVEENRISLQYRLLCFCVFVLEQPLYLRGSRKDLKGVIYYLKITSLKVMSPSVSVCEWTIYERLSLMHLSYGSH